MPEWTRHPILPGNSLLGGAAGGLSYEGVLRDAMAAEERERRREAGRLRDAPSRMRRPQQQQPAKAEHPQR
jgi:hypothetical protein